jgi:hypothetical protein
MSVPPPPVYAPAAEGPDFVERLSDELALLDGEEAPTDDAILEAARMVAAAAYAEPNYDNATAAAALAHFAHLDPTGIVPKSLRDKAILFFHANRTKFANPRFISIIDYGRRSVDPRFFIIDVGTGAVTAYRVAHGSGSDFNHDGWAESFGNVPQSKKSSLGYMRTDYIYQSGKVGTALKLHGLSASNSNVFARGVVIHGSKYVQDEPKVQGRSQGCPAVPMHQNLAIINRLVGGSLVYAGNSKVL